MSYENAPGTKLLATKCAMCAKPLVDSQSVSVGIGPDCRKIHGFADVLTEEQRTEANKLVHFIACEQYDGDEVREALARLDELGCTVIVDRISKRLYGRAIKCCIVAGWLSVKSPYNEYFVAGSRRIRRRQWDGDAKATRFPVQRWQEVEQLLVDSYGRARIVVTDDDGMDTTSALAPGALKALCEDREEEEVVTPPKPPTPVKVVRDAKTDRVAIYCPYAAGVVAAMRDVDCRRWDHTNRVNTFPLDAESEVLAIVRAEFTNIFLAEEDGEVDRQRKRRNRRYAA